MQVFVDYDGTITDRDTFDALVEEFAGAEIGERLDDELKTGVLTLRRALAAQAASLRCSIEQADAFIARAITIDPTFASFVARCEREHVPLTILSSGLGPLIERALARNGLARVPLRANGARADWDGWKMEFLDDSDYGHDKAVGIRETQASGEQAVFIGDGISDLSAALQADRVFAKRGRTLVRLLRDRGKAFTTFESFSQIEHALFS